MNNKLLFPFIFSAFSLGACGNSSSEPSSSEPDSGVIFTVKDPDQSGSLCIINMNIANKTDKKISIAQIMSYTITSDTSTYEGKGHNFRLDPNEVTTRAGISAGDIACDTITSVKVGRVLCWHKGHKPSVTPELDCADDVVLIGSKQITISK